MLLFNAIVIANYCFTILLFDNIANVKTAVSKRSVRATLNTTTLQLPHRMVANLTKNKIETIVVHWHETLSIIAIMCPHSTCSMRDMVLRKSACKQVLCSLTSPTFSHCTRRYIINQLKPMASNTISQLHCDYLVTTLQLPHDHLTPSWIQVKHNQIHASAMQWSTAPNWRHAQPITQAPTGSKIIPIKYWHWQAIYNTPGTRLWSRIRRHEHFKWTSNNSLNTFSDEPYAASHLPELQAHAEFDSCILKKWISTLVGIGTFLIFFLVFFVQTILLPFRSTFQRSWQFHWACFILHINRCPCSNMHRYHLWFMILIWCR